VKIEAENKKEKRMTTMLMACADAVFVDAGERGGGWLDDTTPRANCSTAFTGRLTKLMASL
jgi:hypothetical protein